MTLRITLHIFHTTLALLSMQYLLQWQLTNPCLLPDVITEADRRGGEMCLDEVVVSSCEFTANIRPLK
jgi:hypothetical protein